MVQIIPAARSFKSELGERLGAGIGQGLNALMQGLMQRQEQKKTTEYFKKLAEAHPDEKNYQILADIAASPLEGGQKKDFLKALLSTDPFRAEQQDRLQKDAISRQYNRAISEIDHGLESGAYGYSPAEKNNAKELRRRLVQERDHMLGLGVIQGPEMEESEMFEEEEEIPQKKKETPIKKKPQSKRVKFDVTNPKHKARRDEILKKTGGDRKKAGIVLSKEFELI